jgi:hypothetical protein
VAEIERVPVRKTETIDGVEYVLETMTAGDGLDIQEQVDEAKNDKSPRQKSIDRTLRTVAASLRVSVEDARKLPWPVYLQLIDAALEVNGMKAPAAAPAGEAPAQDGASPAA